MMGKMERVPALKILFYITDSSFLNVWYDATVAHLRTDNYSKPIASYP